MENKKNNHDESGNGFLLGTVIGSIATLLFTTKKGREIIKELTEKGIEKFSELEEALKTDKVIEVIEESDYVVPELRPVVDTEPEKKILAKEVKKDTTPVKSDSKGSVVKSGKTTIRRFFKSSKKS